MPTLEDRYTTLTAEIADTKDGVITGVAAKYNTPVQRGRELFEVLMPGMFKAQVKAPNRVAVLWQHDTESPIGRATDFNDTATELNFKALISRNADIPEARKAMALLEEGIVDEISVGFGWGTWEEKHKDDGLYIEHTKGILREFSVVTFGALGRDARVVTVAAERSMQEALAYKAKLARLRA